LKTIFIKKELLMRENQTVRMMTAGQMKDLASAIVQTIPSDLSFYEAECFIGNKSLFIGEIRKIFSKLRSDHPAANQCLEWKSFYRNVFGIRVDFSKLDIPEKLEGFDRLLIITEGMTPQRLFNKCVELFPSWKWTDSDLDKIVNSDRAAENDVHGAYAVWVRDRVEADEELKNLSANQLKERGVSGITLEERLIYELKYFNETGKHLDINNVTLCSGSRCDDGFVPSVRFYSNVRWVFVYWTNPGDRDGGLRSRQTVSA
jgi:hypothetical protein